MELIPLVMLVLLNYSIHVVKKFNETLELLFKKNAQLNIINRVGERILDLYEVSDTPNMILQNIMDSLPVQACLLYVRAHEDDRNSITLKAELFQNGTRRKLKPGLVSLTNALTDKIHTTKEPILINDTYNNDYNHVLDSNIQSFFLVPLIIHREIIGIICLANKIVPRTGTIEYFSHDDLHLLKSLLTQSAISLENFLLYNNMHDLFMNTIKSLVASIDAKDQYTAGHSERVTAIAEMIGVEMGLTQKQQENLRVSAILHDIGKIGIQESILCSTTRLTNEEFEVIKSHPVKGEEILKHISEFADVIPGVKHHHERFDGNGYPNGLAGKDIPLTARIISVADTFDAITSNRTYRKKRNVDMAVTEIQKCAGSQFDPQIVEYFLKCFYRYRDIKGSLFWEEEESLVVQHAE